ncbi:MAG: hypothetical protein GKS07_06705 [Nitrosopumilus sp.]|nr:MAG: hypothetical protein GKS07_06705 [Nitrosopumilus sp.]
MTIKSKFDDEQDLENKIAELEAKLNQLSTQLVSEPTETKPAEVKPAETPAKPKGTLPKGFEQTQQATPQQQSSYAESGGKSRAEKLKDCEDEYLQRIEQQRIHDEKPYWEFLESEVKSVAQNTCGSLPKGFESKFESGPQKSSRCTLPKGF